MGELVGVGHAAGSAQAAGGADDEQLLDRRVVVADHLAALKGELEVPQRGIGRQQPERPVDALSPGYLGRRVLLVELGREVLERRGGRTMIDGTTCDGASRPRMATTWAAICRYVAASSVDGAAEPACDDDGPGLPVSTGGPGVIGGHRCAAARTMPRARRRTRARTVMPADPTADPAGRDRLDRQGYGASINVRFLTHRLPGSNPATYCSPRTEPSRFHPSSDRRRRLGRRPRPSLFRGVPGSSARRPSRDRRARRVLRALHAPLPPRPTPSLATAVDAAAAPTPTAVRRSTAAALTPQPR